MDIDPWHKPDVVGDHTAMPFADASFDVVVYDPPHVPNQGRDRQKDFNIRFGLVVKSNASREYSSSHMYLPFRAEAYPVLRPEGVLLCKVADYVHGHRYQWAHVPPLAPPGAAVMWSICTRTAGRRPTRPGCRPARSGPGRTESPTHQQAVTRAAAATETWGSGHRTDHGGMAGSSSASKALASRRSGVPKPSVNRP
jgi:hypothetical protein